MSCYTIYYENGAKKMRPVLTAAEYRNLRNAERQQKIVASTRIGDDKLKHRLLQMNYSCMPNEDGTLKGSTTPSNTVGMDVDHIGQEHILEVKERILSKKDELGLLMLELSARGEGYHLVFRRRAELSQEDNLRWASELLGIEFDKGAKDITRVFFTTTASEEDLLFLSDELFEQSPLKSPLKSPLTPEGGTFNCSAEQKNSAGQDANTSESKSAKEQTKVSETPPSGDGGLLSYLGIPYSTIIDRWWQMYNDGATPVKSNRDVLTFELAVNLRHICGFDRNLMAEVIPCYDGFSMTEKMKCIDSALGERRTQMPRRLKDVLQSIQRERMTGTSANNGDDTGNSLDEVFQQDELFYYRLLPKLPMGIDDSVKAVGPHLSMPIVTAICPAIGTLATGVELDVHGKMKNLNLISYVAGDFASGKGSIDPVIDAWMSETKAMDKMYIQQEDEWRAKKRAAKNKKEQPEEPKLPVRCLTLNNTVANLAERLANTEGKHAFSFTPEADTVAQKWRSAMSDFSVMLRESYDGSKYDREAKSADAVNVHIDKLLWNVTMCGTPDALYRVVNNYTDGFQSRIAVARTPDNTFAPLEDKPYVLTTKQQERIQQVAHLLPLMNGTVVLPKLEAKSRQWVEQIRVETMKDDDRTRARQRFRVCVTTQRMVCCLMLCKVAEQLIQKHGTNGAEMRMKQNPALWKEMLLKAQTPSMLSTYDVIADYLLENALYFFRDKIEAAFTSATYKSTSSWERLRRGKNDSIFERLDVEFSFEQAFQQSVAVKGANTTRNAVQQMLKNWKKQTLIQQLENGRFIKK